ncbi:MAG: hypothetical protein DRR00_25215 [Candidatus Parabeggiatoa sp. nov. 3]|nr:MAG: hypothetical protein DRR00_25215 [Gammaproteobacteria bacterium]
MNGITLDISLFQSAILPNKGELAQQPVSQSSTLEKSKRLLRYKTNKILKRKRRKRRKRRYLDNL